MPDYSCSDPLSWFTNSSIEWNPSCYCCLVDVTLDEPSKLPRLLFRRLGTTALLLRKVYSEIFETLSGSSYKASEKLPSLLGLIALSEPDLDFMNASDGLARFPLFESLSELEDGSCISRSRRGLCGGLPASSYDSS